MMSITRCTSSNSDCPMSKITSTLLFRCLAISRRRRDGLNSNRTQTKMPDVFFVMGFNVALPTVWVFELALNQ